MIISDLQYIESAIETEVQGGDRGGTVQPPGGNRGFVGPLALPFSPLAYNVAGAEAVAQAFGTNTRTSTTTETLVIQGQFSGSYSSSFAEAF